MQDKNMSDAMVQAIEEVSPAGLESMLEAIERAALQEQDYSTVFSARANLEQQRLDLTDENILESQTSGSSDLRKRKKQYYEAIKQIHLDMAEYYMRDGELTEAAQHLASGEVYGEAVELYREEGSDKSLDEVISITIYHIDFGKGIMMLAEKDGTEKAFWKLDDARYASTKISDNEKQKIADKLIKKLYSESIEEIKTQIKKQGKEIPSTNSLTELAKKENFLLDTFWKLYSINYILETEDPNVLNIGIEIFSYLREKIEHYNDNNERGLREIEHYKDREMWLRGMSGEVDKAVSYFIKKTEDHQTQNEYTMGTIETYAKHAIKILEHHEKYEQALGIAEKFLSPGNFVRLSLLKELGHKQELLGIYKEHNEPIKYARTLAEE